jgi:hypothetical protein
VKRCVLALLVGSLLFACTLAAQESSEPSRGPDGGTRFRVAGIEVLPVAGKPFTGHDTIEWTRNLEDGTVVTTHLEAVVARDSQGRIYRERRTFVPVNTPAQQSQLVEIIFLDPAAHTRTTCTVATRHCAVTGYFARASYAPPQAGPLANGTRYLSRESLGANVVDDLDVVGTRETLAIDAGAVGNNRPLVATREFWYSPDLQTNLSVTRKDPREGTQVIRLVDLSRTEPDPALFQLPPGFSMQEPGPSAKAQN